MKARKPTKEEQLKLLLELWNEGKTLFQAAEILKLKPETIRKYARRDLGIKFKRGNKSSLLGSEDKVAFLKRNYESMSAHICAIALGYNVDYIRQVAAKLGLRHSPEYIAETYRQNAIKIKATKKKQFEDKIYIINHKRDPLTGRFIKQSKE